MPLPEVSVIIVSWNTRELTDKAIASFYAFEKTTPFEIILIDNASGDDSVRVLSQKYPQIQIIRNSKNMGFAYANNQGVSAARGSFVLLMNSDAYLHQEVLPDCLKQMGRTESILACKILNPDGSLQLSASPFPSLRNYLPEILFSEKKIRRKYFSHLSGLRDSINPVDWLCGAFLLTRKKCYLDLGGLSEKIFMYGEDVEFCWRAAKAKIPRYFVPSVSIIHLGGGSTDYTSMRSLIIVDSGRLITFEIMKGKAQAFLLRCIFMSRSLFRVFLYLIPAFLSKEKAWGQKMRNHFLEVLILGGWIDGRDFI